jgi:DNA repair exonuclease SbcCD ATPase subunit
MRYIHFKRLKATNFLSIGKKPVEITFRPGLNIITGRNFDKADRANGVGKSTIADAMHFALYGSTIRELKKENIVNDQAPDSLCEVELEFTCIQGDASNTYKIIRTLNPTKCYLFMNDQEITRSGVPQTTEYIIDIIKTSPEVFQNSVVMTINNTVPFMAQKKVEKRKFIEGILGLEVFGNMLLFVRHDYNENKRNLEVETTKFEEINRSLQENVKQKELYDVNKEKRLETLKTRQTNNGNELFLLKEKLDKFEPVNNEAKAKLEEELKNFTSAKKVLASKLLEIERLITEANTHIKINTDRNKKLKKVDSKCPHCGKDLAEAVNTQYEKDKSDCIKEIEKYQEVLNANTPKHKDVTDKISKLEESLSKLQTRFNDFVIRKKEVENVNSRITQLEAWQQQLLIDIENLNKDSNNFERIILDITNRVNETKNGITALQFRLEIIENAKLIVSEEGVKSYIVKKIIEVLNSRLGFYLKKLESNSIVRFNEFFEEVITNERGKECSYFNFSGAERKAIDLAMLFTFQDIRRAQADVCLNLSMFDELFDSSLDEKGIELVLDILKERVDNYNEAIYIISHRKESKKYCIGGEIIFLEKKNGITTRTTNYDLS